jgi:hypothetical protein
MPRNDGFIDWLSQSMPQEPWHLEPPPDGSAEDDKERDWAYLEGEARDFAKKYGVAALVRCIASATE